MPELRDGTYRTLPAPNDDVWVWLRGERTVVACNLSDAAVDIEGIGPGENPDLDDPRPADERVDAGLHLAPWESAIVWRD